MKDAIVSLVTVLCLGVLVGCGRSPPGAPDVSQNDPGGMLEHIAAEHGIRIAAGTNADIVVTRTSNTVTVAFTPGIVKRLPQDCLPVLHFAGPEKVFTQKEYEGFLDDLHDYLLLTYGEGRGPKP